MKMADIEEWKQAIADIYEGNICTKNLKGSGTCNGDSGGALTYNNTLLGIVSWSVGCENGYPCIHTKIYPHLEWINDHLIENEN